MTGWGLEAEVGAPQSRGSIVFPCDCFVCILTHCGAHFGLKTAPRIEFRADCKSAYAGSIPTSASSI